MSNVKSVWLTMAASAVLLSFAATAQAAGPEFCESYAHAAEIQVRAGFSNPNCAGSLHGTRWSAEYRVHYDWCRQVPSAEAVAERDTRTAHLKACR